MQMIINFLIKAPTMWSFTVSQSSLTVFDRKQSQYGRLCTESAVAQVHSKQIVSQAVEFEVRLNDFMLRSRRKLRFSWGIIQNLSSMIEDVWLWYREWQIARQTYHDMEFEVYWILMVLHRPAG